MNIDDSQTDDEIQGKVIDLASRIKNAKSKTAFPETEKTGESDETQKPAKEHRAGTEFLSSVIGGGILGYATDWLFGTLPWGLLFFLIMGFISAVYRANEAMRDE